MALTLTQVNTSATPNTEGSLLVDVGGSPSAPCVITIRNTHATATIAIGPPGVTISTGFLLPAGQETRIYVASPVGDINVISATALVPVSVAYDYTTPDQTPTEP